MSTFHVIVFYCSIIYLLFYLWFIKEEKHDKWEYILLYTAPISVPIIIIWIVFMFMIED